MEILKHSSINGNLLMKEIPYDIAKQMMLENHYSKKWNTSFGKINVGIFKDDVLLGCASFGNLMNPNSYKNITSGSKDSVIELNRMWISDELGRNSETILISSSIKIIKKKYPHIKYVQSFADGRLGCGTIYKAANFKYFGCESSLFFQDNQSLEFFHKVPLENTKRPQGFLLKNKKYLDGVLSAFYVNTYRYIYPLDPKNSPILLKESIYPEYSKGLELVNYTHSFGLLCRLYIMYNHIGDTEYADKVMLHIHSLNYSKTQIDDELKNQLQNESVVWFINDYTKNPKNVKSLLGGDEEIQLLELF